MNITKPHPNISIRTTVSVNFSADQWRLRTNECSRVIIEKVADSFNKRLSSTFNAGFSKNEIMAAYTGLQSEFLPYITAETESVYHDVVRVLHKESA